VTYGTSSAPFLATCCLKKLADDNQCQYPRAAQVISNDFYIHDLLSGTSTVEDATRNINSAANSRAYIEKVGIQPLRIFGYNSQGAARNTAEITR
jgi:hypothetical protein